MKNSSILIVSILSIFFLTACGDEVKENHNKSVKNPVNTYLDSRVNAMDLAKKSVGESNKRAKEQDKALEALMK